MTQPSPPAHPDLEAWRARVQQELAGAPFTALQRRAREGFRWEPLYTGGPARPQAVPRRAGSPVGCVLADVGEPAALAPLVAEDVAGGAEQVWLRLDRASRVGSSDPADRGVNGVAVHTLAEALALVGSAPSVRLDAGANPLALTLAEALRAAGAGPVTVALDPVAALAADGALPGPAHEVAARALQGLAGAEALGGPVLGASGAPWYEAGGHAVHAVGMALASGLWWLRQADTRGVAPDAVARQLLFSLPMGRDLLTAVASVRALRRLWAQVLAATGVNGPPALVHAHGLLGCLARRDAWVNLLRTSGETFAALVAGADVVTTTPFDRPLGMPDAQGRRIARNTVAVLRDEAHLGTVEDLAAGSHAVEAVTDELARGAWALVRQVEAAGGAIEAHHQGLVAGWVEAAWAERRRLLSTRREPVLGVSEFAFPEEPRLVRSPPPAPDEANRRLAAWVTRRGPGAWGAMEPTRAWAAGATWAELTASGVASGRALSPRSDAEPFEGLRDRVDRHRLAGGAAPRAVLALLGAPSARSARAAWMRNLLQAGGLQVEEAEAADVSPGELVVLCGPDATYDADAEAHAARFFAAGAVVGLAGRPLGEDRAARLSAAGVGPTFFAGADAEAALADLLDRLGVAP